MIAQEVPIFQADLLRLLNIKHPNTLREMIRRNKVPGPDVRITAKTKYWHRASLVKAGLLPEEATSSPNPEASGGAQ